MDTHTAKRVGLQLGVQLGVQMGGGGGGGWRVCVCRWGLRWGGSQGWSLGE